MAECSLVIGDLMPQSYRFEINPATNQPGMKL